METKPRLLRITTVPVSLKLLLEGQFIFFQQQGFEVLTVSADGPEREYLKANNVPHEVVPMTRMITPLQDLYCLFRLIQVMRKFQPDIVHTHTPKAGLLGMLAAWVCRVPARLHTVAGLPLMETTGLKRWLLRITEQITYACAHRVYPNSSGLMEYIRGEFGAAAANLKLIGKGSSNGIDTVFFSRNEFLEKQASGIRDQYKFSKEDIVFSFVGRVVRDKGVFELVHAFKKIADEFPVRLLLIGPLEEELDPLPAETLTKIRRDNRIILTGFQHDVRPWIMASDVFVFPSYREGFPNVVMQAACLEVPCIVSDINGCNEIIQSGKTGLVIPPKNVDALCDAMRSLATDREKRSLFGKLSRDFVVKNFERQAVWQALLDEYRSCLR